MFAKEGEVTLPHQNVVPQRAHQVVDPNRLAAGFVGKPFQSRAERAHAAPLQPFRAALGEPAERLPRVGEGRHAIVTVVDVPAPAAGLFAGNNRPRLLLTWARVADPADRASRGGLRRSLTRRTRG